MLVATAFADTIAPLAVTEYPAEGHDFDPNGPNAWLLLAGRLSLSALAAYAVAHVDALEGRIEESAFEHAVDQKAANDAATVRPAR